VFIRFTVFIYEIHRGLRQSWLYHRPALALRSLTILYSRQSDERALWGATGLLGKGDPRCMAINLSWLTPALGRAYCHMESEDPKWGQFRFNTGWVPLPPRKAHLLQLLRITVSESILGTLPKPMWLGWLVSQCCVGADMAIPASVCR
jgi:hypothetical protein